MIPSYLLVLGWIINCMQTMMDRNNLRETFSFTGSTDSLTHSSTKFIILLGFYTYKKHFIRHNIETIVTLFIYNTN